MRRRNTQILIGIAILAALAITLIIPAGGAKLGKEDFDLGLDLRGGTQLVYQADLSVLGEDESPSDAMKAIKDIVKKRIDKYGVSEPIVQLGGGGDDRRLIVQLPGVSDLDEAMKLIGETAQLEFKEQKLDEAGIPVLDEQGNPEWIVATATGIDGQEKALTGQYLKRNAHLELTGQLNEPVVAFEWDEEGAKLFEQITGRLIGKPLGIFLDEELISAPTVRSVIKDKGVIEGVPLKRARRLAIQLNTGALPVPLGRWEGDEFLTNEPLMTDKVDATLGKDSLNKSLVAGLVGGAMLLLFMLLYYRLPGSLACGALLIYGVLVLAAYKVFPGFTLTLAGIAGFILSLGMAVDANVLIFERMKEEIRRGRTPGAAVEHGFNRAWPAIRDGNVSTFITCGILYWFGSELGASPVQGFALTLGIGVAISMFSAIVVTRSFLRFIVGTRWANRLSAFKVGEG